MKCHKCKREITDNSPCAWYRGPLVFCSAKCRQESLDEGERLPDELSLGAGDENIKVAGRP
jgi:hypothetical protein